MGSRIVALAGALLLVPTLASCNIDGGEGYVEIKAVPPSASIPLYLDQAKLEPLRNGNAVLRQKVGTAKLQTDMRWRRPHGLAVQYRGEEEPHHQRDGFGHEPPAALPVRAHQRHRHGRQPDVHRVDGTAGPKDQGDVS